MKMVKGFDIIGDVHGCALTLQALLEKMGYQSLHGVYQHKNRQAIFVGDIIDRGPRVRESLNIVRKMVESGHAQLILGNHEYYAMGYYIPAIEDPKRFVRDHTPAHTRVIQETLDQFAPYQDEWLDHLKWFHTLPIYIETDSFRVIHACWDQPLIDRFNAKYPEGCLDKNFIQLTTNDDNLEAEVVWRLLRGTDLPLPDGLVIESEDGIIRDRFRTKFWAQNPSTYGDVVFQPDGLSAEVAKRYLSEHEKASLLTYGYHEKPLFLGHYWCDGKPKILSPNIACVDYSAVKYGKLVAYQIDNKPPIDDGYPPLSNDNFIWVDVPRPD